MSKFSALALFFACFCGAAWSQAEPAHGERLNKARVAREAKESKDDPQQRRAAVRAALGSAREPAPGIPDDAPKARRQLSAQERQLLRQQLRQQRGDALEPEKRAGRP